MAEWPSFKHFMYMLVGGVVIAGIVGFTYGELQDAWQSHNPWIYVPAGIALGIGWLIVGIIWLWSEISSVESVPRGHKPKNQAPSP